MSSIVAVTDLALVRDAVNAGEWWRLWTGHLVHTGARHLAGNLTAVAILGVVAFRLGLVRAAVCFSILAMPLISIGLLLLLPQLQWYAGMSGVLHGLLALILMTRMSLVTWLGLGLLATKLLMELNGAWPTLPGGYPVISEAHLLGFACGIMAGLAQYAYRRHKPYTFLNECRCDRNWWWPGRAGCGLRAG